MQRAQIEYLVLGVIEHMLAGRPAGEVDSRFELKRFFPRDHIDTARRLAGHANASNGEEIIWIIGLDDTPGAGALLGCDDTPDLADWWGQIEKRFEKPALQLIQHFPVTPDGGKTSVLALCFATDAAPFVVHNPKGGYPEHEVPWRDGTRLRAARRSDLLRLLVPRASLPHVEMLDVEASLTPSSAGSSHAKLRCMFYLATLGSEPVAIPGHRCGAWLSLEGEPRWQQLKITEAVMLPASSQASPMPIVLQAAATTATIGALGTVAHPGDVFQKRLRLKLALCPVRPDAPIVIEGESQNPMRQGNRAVYKFQTTHDVRLPAL